MTDEQPNAGAEDFGQTLFTGLRPELERFHELDAVAVPMHRTCLLSDMPEQLFSTPPMWNVIHNQGPIGSCRGHHTTTAAEICMYQATGELVQLSRMYSYLSGQKLDGLLGRDVGSTVTGGIQAAKAGICAEEHFPYPSSYTSRIPQAAIDHAPEYRLRSNTPRMYSYDNDIRPFLRSNAGGVLLWCKWPLRISNGVAESYSAGNGGLHAITGCFLSTRKDSSGRPYVWVANSHGTQYAKAGYLEMSPTCVSQILQAHDCYGISDMDVPEPRMVDYSKAENSFYA